MNFQNATAMRTRKVNNRTQNSRSVLIRYVIYCRCVLASRYCTACQFHKLIGFYFLVLLVEIIFLSV